MLLHIKYNMFSEKIFFLSFSYNKFMEAIDTQGVASFYPRGLICRINVGDH